MKKSYKKTKRLSLETGLVTLVLLLLCNSCSSAKIRIEEQQKSTPVINQLSMISTPGTIQKVSANETEELDTLGRNEPEVNDWSSPEYKARAFSILHKKLTLVTEYSCPMGCKAHLNDCDIKGNISYTSKEKIFHAPGQEYYDPTVITPMFGERWFCTEEEAFANGWRKSRK
jgi:hypothetical protein